MWRATFKSLLARKLRLLLTAIAVVLGVGFMAGTLVLTDTLTRTFDDLFATAAANTDVVVRGTSAFEESVGGGPGGGGGEERKPLPAAVLEDVRAVPGVLDAEGEVNGYAQIVDPGTDEPIGGSGPPTIGTSWSELSAALTIRQGEPPSGPDEVAVDAGTAEEHGITVGQQIRVLLIGPTKELTVSGIVGFGEADNLGGATLAVFDLETAQELFDRVGEYDTISVVGEEGISPQRLGSEISAALPDGYEAVTAATAAAESADEVQQGLGFLRTALLVFAFVSLFVGAFIIFNTFNIIVTQRTRELGLLRALGASRRQVQTSVLVEAIVVGLAASLVGIGVGILLAFGLQALLAGFGIDLPSTETIILPRTIVVGIAVGTLVTVVASVAPARRASRVSPIEALREGGSAPSATPFRRVLVGSLLTAGGVAALLYGLFGNPSNAGLWVGAGAAFTFVGAASLSPLVARPLAAVIGAPIRRLGFAGRLGHENAMRNPRRTASTAAALMIGLGLVTFVAVFGASLKASADAAVDETLRADFILSTDNFSSFSPQVAVDLRERPEFAAVSPYRQGEVRVNDRSAFVSGVDPATLDEVLNLEFSSGDLAALEDPGAVLVYRGVASSDDLAVGDQLGMEFASTGEQGLTVGGIYTDNRQLGDYTISLDAYETNFAQQLDFIVFTKLAAGTSPAEGRAVIEQVVEESPNVQVQDQAEYKEQAAQAIDQFLALVQVLLLLAIVIALFGIVNTLGLSIYERVRELGLLRAVGMGRRQVRRMIRSEAVIIAILGALMGIVIGVLFGWAMQQALASLGINRLAIPVGSLAIYIVVAGLAGVVAAIWPARRAAKLNVLESIAYE